MAFGFVSQRAKRPRQQRSDQKDQWQHQQNKAERNRDQPSASDMMLAKNSSMGATTAPCPRRPDRRQHFRRKQAHTESDANAPVVSRLLLGVLSLGQDWKPPGQFVFQKPEMSDTIVELLDPVFGTSHLSIKKVEVLG